MKYNNFRCGVRYKSVDGLESFVQSIKTDLGEDYENCDYGHACFGNYELKSMYLALPYERKYEQYFPILESLLQNTEIKVVDKFYFEEKESEPDAYGSTKKTASVVDNGNEVFVIWLIQPSEEYTFFAGNTISRIIGCLLRYFSSGEYFVDHKNPEGDFINWLCKLNNRNYDGHSIGNYQITPELIQKIDNIELVNKLITRENCYYSYSRNQDFFTRLDREN